MNGMSMLGMPMPGMHGTPISGMTMALPPFAAVVLAQRLLPPRRTLDLSVALALIALGIATVAA
jgi:hypothetical protein